MRSEEVLNWEARREKKCSRAIVKPSEIPWVEDNPGGIAVSPLDKQVLLADEHFLRRSLSIKSSGCESEATGEGWGRQALAECKIFRAARKRHVLEYLREENQNAGGNRRCRSRRPYAFPSTASAGHRVHRR